MTPEALMRSRYEAFVRRDWEYLAKTATNQTVAELSTTPPLEWLKLEVVDAVDTMVEFKAYYRDGKRVELLHERSYFILDQEGNWKYDHGDIISTKIQRNEPCPCGSNKKFKRCCGQQA